MTKMIIRRFLGVFKAPKTTPARPERQYCTRSRPLRAPSRDGHHAAARCARRVERFSLLEVRDARPHHDIQQYATPPPGGREAPRGARRRRCRRSDRRRLGAAPDAAPRFGRLAARHHDSVEPRNASLPHRARLGDDLPQRTLGTDAVADAFPAERTCAESAWLKIACGVVPGVAPAVLGPIPEAGVLALEYLDPEESPSWQSRLVAGRIEPWVAAELGHLIGRLHAVSANSLSVTERFAAPRAVPRARARAAPRCGRRRSARLHDAARRARRPPRRDPLRARARRARTR